MWPYVASDAVASELNHAATAVVTAATMTSTCGVDDVAPWT